MNVPRLQRRRLTSSARVTLTLVDLVTLQVIVQRHIGMLIDWAADPANSEPASASAAIVSSKAVLAKIDRAYGGL